MSARTIRAAEINAAGGHNLLLEGASEAELIRARVEKARERQKARGVLNAALTIPDLHHLSLSLDAEEWGNAIRVRLARTDSDSLAWFNLLRIARTIADLAGSGLVCAAHLEEAATYLPEKES